MTHTYEYAVIHAIAGGPVTMQTATSRKTLGNASSKDRPLGNNLGGFLEQLDLLSSQGWETVNVDLHEHIWTLLLRRRRGRSEADPAHGASAPPASPTT